jgi:hypothetical protein
VFYVWVGIIAVLAPTLGMDPANYLLTTREANAFRNGGQRWHLWLDFRGLPQESRLAFGTRLAVGMATFS